MTAAQSDRPDLLWVIRVTEEADQARMVRDALRESTPLEVAKSGPGILPGDRLALRGIPVQAVGVGGTMLGTQPEREALRRG